MNELLLQGLSELGLDVSRAETLERFSSLLLEKNEVMNLTAITVPDAVAQLHLLDSAALLPFVDLTGKTVVDVGTGAGFPGMPLRILKDDFDLTLLDSLGKRVNWLQEVCDELQLKRVACVHARAEEFAMQHREQFDIATSRAVAQLSILSELCLPLVKIGGQFVAMKSVDTEDEIAAAKSAIKTLGGHIVKVEDYTIPTSDVVHRLVIVEKVSPTPRSDFPPQGTYPLFPAERSARSGGNRCLYSRPHDLHSAQKRWSALLHHRFLQRLLRPDVPC